MSKQFPGRSQANPSKHILNSNTYLIYNTTLLNNIWRNNYFFYSNMIKVYIHNVTSSSAFQVYPLKPWWTCNMSPFRLTIVNFEVFPFQHRMRSIWGKTILKCWVMHFNLKCIEKDASGVSQTPPFTIIVHSRLSFGNCLISSSLMFLLPMIVFLRAYSHALTSAIISLLSHPTSSILFVCSNHLTTRESTLSGIYNHHPSLN